MRPQWHEGTAQDVQDEQPATPGLCFLCVPENSDLLLLHVEQCQKLGDVGKDLKKRYTVAAVRLSNLQYLHVNITDTNETNRKVHRIRRADRAL